MSYSCAQHELFSRMRIPLFRPACRNFSIPKVRFTPFRELFITHNALAKAGEFARAGEGTMPQLVSINIDRGRR